MRKISQILEAKRDQLLVERIVTESDLFKFAHQVLKDKNGYSEDSANMMVENLMETYPEDLQKAAQEIENFRQRG